ncbi:phosphatidylethanolamine-binding pebp [Venturia nashicola]|uniref:Phosphatidylethanolamine-binding pebp n=1 Tax=Venturia nashicola TaxID=86259 RepID=A0A4Z1NWQ8_9PEZI|nr:phosphatidylethanolamine-binding pebp [Venturia nashicola]TLD14824.1 phosphatidylethanolamine-binding pebp [Venturia nashicola]
MVSKSEKAILLMLNIDYPVKGRRLQNLYWLSHNIPLTSTFLDIPNTNGTIPLCYDQPTKVWEGDTAHQYVFLLYHQPPSFAFNSSYMDTEYSVSEKRIGYGLGDPQPVVGGDDTLGFDLAVFEADNQLGRPVAASYFTMYKVRQKDLAEWQEIEIEKQVERVRWEANSTKDHLNEEEREWEMVRAGLGW